jgi:hypothetical protein
MSAANLSAAEKFVLETCDLINYNHIVRQDSQRGFTGHKLTRHPKRGYYCSFWAAGSGWVGYGFNRTAAINNAIHNCYMKLYCSHQKIAQPRQLAFVPSEDLDRAMGHPKGQLKALSIRATL